MVRDLRTELKIICRILQKTFFTRNGGTDSISWEHKHFIYFLYKKLKINLAACLFEHLFTAINDSVYNGKPHVNLPRLISELIRQTKLVDIISKYEHVQELRGSVFNATSLVHFGIIKGPIITPNNPLLKKDTQYDQVEGFPIISEADNKEVIREFLKLGKEETQKNVGLHQIKPAGVAVSPKKRKNDIDAPIIAKKLKKRYVPAEISSETRTKKKHDPEATKVTSEENQEVGQKNPSAAAESETESDEGPIIFTRPKLSTKGSHLDQNMKQNTDFYKQLKEVKTLGGIKKKKKKKKSTETKLSAVST
jgi:hypothetical protein